MVGKGKEFLEMYGKVAKFTKDLMEENSKLQSRINNLMNEQEGSLTGGAVDASETELVRRIAELKREKEDVLSQYNQVEDENKDFLDRYYEIEAENNNLANLYVASYQLHSTLDLFEVLEIITEIIINLVGAQSFGVLLFNEKKGVLEPVSSNGIPREALPSVRSGEGIIGSVAQSGDTYYCESMDRPHAVDTSNPLVVVPLKIQDETIGLIVVYQFLSQKEKLEKIDYDLFSLLAAHAATAIFSSRLYGDSIRKQETIKGFLDLLTH